MLIKQRHFKLFSIIFLSNSIPDNNLFSNELHIKIPKGFTAVNQACAGNRQFEPFIFYFYFSLFFIRFDIYSSGTGRQILLSPLTLTYPFPASVKNDEVYCIQ